LLLYRVFPYLEGVAADEPGHALYVHPRQGSGRWDNPGRYLARYLATSPVSAIGEAFAHLKIWTPAMLRRPDLSGSERRIGVYQFDDTISPLLDLDDASVLLERHLRPTDVVIRNRAKTQQIAAQVFDEGRWAGIEWWSYHRPQWSLVVLWAAPNLTVRSVERLPGHAALDEAANSLLRVRRGI
jgi:RES domain-containing protein